MMRAAIPSAARSGWLVPGLLVIAIGQGALLALLSLWGSEGDATNSPTIGSVPDLLVREAGASRTNPLTSYGAGSCRLLIVYSPTCGASLTAARRWHQDLARSTDNRVAPPGWTVAWLSVEDSVPSSGFLPDGFPLPRLYSSGAGAVYESLGIGEYPAYLLLDRAGTILSAGLGAPLYSLESYRADCTIQSAKDARDGV